MTSLVFANIVNLSRFKTVYFYLTIRNKKYYGGYDFLLVISKLIVDLVICNSMTECSCAWHSGAPIAIGVRSTMHDCQQDVLK